MEVLFIIALLFVYIPVVCAILARNACDLGGPDEGVLTCLYRGFKNSSDEERYIQLLNSIIIVSAPLAVHVFYVSPELRATKIIGLALVGIMTVLSVAFVITSTMIREYYSNYSKIIYALIGLTITINVPRSTSFAEGIIASAIGVPANQLPTALAWLTMLMTPISLVFIFAFYCVGIYVVALLMTCFDEKKESTNSSPLNQIYIKKNTSRRTIAWFATAASFAILAISPLNFTIELLGSNWAERTVRESIVSASFHANATDCGISEVPESGKNKIKVAYLDDEKAIIAIPHEIIGYTFERIACPKIWKSPDSINKKLAMSRVIN